MTVSSGLAARMRGPGMSPALMALRMTTSSRGLAEAALKIAGEALVEHHLGVLHRLQRVLLGRDVAQPFERRGVAEADMAVGLDQARHQRGAAAVDQSAAPSRGSFFAGLGDLLDPVAFDQHLAGIGLRACAIQDVDVGEERAAHLILP